ncbi:proline dehydrogenase family protein [Pimelobacter simplex]|uniref:proline dehydrogenase family protein n=1 Tax=Nocardioides simplex TaxID=2045 RepID=UPI003AAD7BA4
MRPVRDSLMLLSRSVLGRRIVRTFVPGDRVDDAVRAVAEVRTAGFAVGVERLGAPAGSVVAEYRTLIDRLADAGLATGTDLTIGVVPLDEARKICRTAAGAGTTVTVGATDADADARIALVTALRADFPGVGVVLDAALPRTEGDCRALAGPGSRVRLVRGADSAEADKAYVRCLKVLLGGAGYPIVATHDPRLLEIAVALASRYGRAPATYELQLRYGVRPAEQQRLAGTGEQVRVLLPYGPDWHGYLAAQLAERPANLSLLLTSLIPRK